MLRGFELGMRSERETFRRVEELDAAVTSLDRRLHELAADHVLDGVRGSADARALWDSADVTRRRRFLASLIERVEVGRWPEGMATTVTRRSSERLARRAGRAVETVEEFAERQAEHTREAMRQRVTVTWRA